MKKNDTVELYIEDITAEGSGVGRIDGLAVFVPHTAPGDRVRAKIIKLTRSYGVAKLEKILSPAHCRIRNRTRRILLRKGRTRPPGQHLRIWTQTTP